MKEELFETKNYTQNMNVTNARIKFRMRVQLVPGIKYSYKNTQKYKDELWSCPVCELTGDYSLDSLPHTFWCPGLTKLRENRDLNIDEDVVSYMKDVLRLRECISSKNED